MARDGDGETSPRDAAVTIHPVTLCFSDDKLEEAIRDAALTELTVSRKYHIFFGITLILLVFLKYIDTMLPDSAEPAAKSATGAVASVAMINFALMAFFTTPRVRDKRKARRIIETCLIVTFSYLNIVPYMDGDRHSVMLSRVSNGMVRQENVFQASWRCYVLTVIVVGVHLMHLDWTAKLAVIILPPLSHTLTPIWSLGWLEGAMWWGSASMSALMGYVVERSHREAFLQRECMRRMDEEAVHTMSHCLKNRFITLRGLEAGLRNTFTERASSLLHEPQNVRLALDDLRGQIDGGIRMCLSESVIRMITHGQYVRTDVEFDLVAELETLCGTRISLSIGADVPRRICSDFNLILIVLENFTSNATKYSREGSEVHLVVKALPSQRLHIAVHNSPSKMHDQLRERFGSSQEAAARLFVDGEGVHTHTLSTRKGLAHAKSCAAVLGGEVALRFEPQEVVATLVFSYTVLPAALCLPRDTLIAIVDDLSLIRTMDRELLRRANIDPASSDHVRGATVEEILSFPEYVMAMHPRPHIVLVDQNLDHPLHRTSLVKGTDLVRRLRSLGYDGKILMKTASHGHDDARDYAASGADGVVAKGLNELDLNRRLARVYYGVCGGDVSTIEAEGAEANVEPAAKPSISRSANGVSSEANAGNGESATSTPNVASELSTQVIAPDMLEFFDDRLKQSLVEELREGLLLQLEKAIQRSDDSSAGDIVHAIRGVAGNVGAKRVQQLCETRRQRRAEANDERLAWTTFFRSLTDEVDRLLEALP